MLNDSTSMQFYKVNTIITQPNYQTCLASAAPDPFFLSGWGGCFFLNMINFFYIIAHAYINEVTTIQYLSGNNLCVANLLFLFRVSLLNKFHICFFLSIEDS